MADTQSWGASRLRALANAFASQEHVGVLGGLILRLARFLGGDPVQWITVTSTTFTDVHGLPDQPLGESFSGQVIGNAITYRIDGSAPVGATDPTMPVGTFFTLTGRPSIIAFRFASASVSAATVTGAYND